MYNLVREGWFSTKLVVTAATEPETFSQVRKMTISIIVQDKVKTPGILEGINYYRKLCAGWLTVTIDATADLFKASRRGSASHDSAIFSLAKPTDFLVVLDREPLLGKRWSPDSLEFAGFLDEIMRGSYHRLLFAVGGPDGFKQEVLARADRVMTISPLTFPHDLVPLILAEQIYRSLTILHRHPYHR